MVQSLATSTVKKFRVLPVCDVMRMCGKLEKNKNRVSDNKSVARSLHGIVVCAAEKVITSSGIVNTLHIIIYNRLMKQRVCTESNVSCTQHPGVQQMFKMSSFALIDMTEFTRVVLKNLHAELALRCTITISLRCWSQNPAVQIC